MRWKAPLWVWMSSGFGLLVLAVALAVGAMSYLGTGRLVDRQSARLFDELSGQAAQDVESLFGPAKELLDIAARAGVVQAPDLESRLQSLPLFAALLNAQPAVRSVFLGLETGDHFQLRRYSAAEDASWLQAPAAVRFVVQSLERQGGGARARLLLLDQQLQRVEVRDSPELLDFDPRLRPWYIEAQASDGVIRTAPYRFFSSQRPGITLALRSPIRAGAVLGIDLRIEALSATLGRWRITPHTQIALATASGELLAQPGPYGGPAGELPPALKALLRGLGAARDNGLRTQVIDPTLGEMRVLAQRMPTVAGEPLWLLVAVPGGELMADALHLRDRALLGVALVVLLALPLAYLLSRRLSGDLDALAVAARRLQGFELAGPVEAGSRVREVDDVALGLDHLRVAQLRLLQLSASISAEQDFKRLLPVLLAETAAAVQAADGVLWLAGDDAGSAAAESLQCAACQRAGRPFDAGPLSLPALPPTLSGPQAVLLQPDAATRAALALPDGSGPVLNVPLVNRSGQALGVLVLGGLTGGEEGLAGFAAAFSGIATVTLESRSLLRAQKRLFEALIQLIAGAIDEKSPYTGGHCARVPALTEMVARAACEARSGAFAGFSLSEADWEAVHIAAWLHDCGKVTTPEFVVDKATKLETITDRLHEVRMRFELLKCEAEVRRLRAVVAGADAHAAQAECDAERAALDADFAFVAECNLGSEAMAPTARQRLQAIAQRQWWRTLDDRLGLAPGELARRPPAVAPVLPVLEPLLADRPEHRIPWPESSQPGVASALARPAWLYDRGELHNLGILRGTLTEEERFKINDHIVQTIGMLERLPWPAHLRGVPELAGAHHERMDGKGYPRALTGAQMSPVARMMALADVFEALTASDRPYKLAKTLSEALDIMAGMARGGHLDPEVFELFLNSGVARDYAVRHMGAEMVDAPDLPALLRRARGEA